MSFLRFAAFVSVSVTGAFVVVVGQSLVRRASVLNVGR